MVRLATLTLNPAIDVATSVPRLAPVAKLRCRPETRDAGGGGINVARVAQRLGAQVLAVHASGGATGQLLGALLDREHLPHRPLAVEGDTRESFTVVDEATTQEYRFVLPGPALAPGRWQEVLAPLDDLPNGLDGLVASGSLPPGAPTDLYATVATRAARRGLPLSLDASGDALAAALCAGGLALIKPNLRELQELVGRELPDTAQRLAACRALIASGAVATVALSMGERGAMLVNARGAWECPALAVPVRSSVGAGDSFLAALVVALAEGMAEPQALARAVAAGSAALLNPGTRLASADDMARLLPQASPQVLELIG